MPNLEHKYKYGDVILFRSTGGFVSNAIGKIDGSEYSHGAIFWKYSDGVPLFIESHEARGGVVVNKLQEWGNFDVYRPLHLAPRPVDEMLSLIGRKYDYNLLWWIFKSKVLRRKQYNNDDLQLICTELVDHCYYYSIGNGCVCTPKTTRDFCLEFAVKI